MIKLAMDLKGKMPNKVKLHHIVSFPSAIVSFLDEVRRVAIPCSVQDVKTDEMLCILSSDDPERLVQRPALRSEFELPVH